MGLVHINAYSNTEDRRYFKFNSLVERRNVGDLSFFYKIVNNLIDAPDINKCFKFAPAALDLSRNRLLKTAKPNKNYVMYRPHNRITKLLNLLHS